MTDLALRCREVLSQFPRLPDAPPMDEVLNVLVPAIEAQRGMATVYLRSGPLPKELACSGERCDRLTIATIRDWKTGRGTLAPRASGVLKPFAFATPFYDLLTSNFLVWELHERVYRDIPIPDDELGRQYRFAISENKRRRSYIAQLDQWFAR